MSARHHFSPPRRVRAALIGALATFAAASANQASAQSIIPNYSQDPALVRMQERMDALEAQVRDATGENERLRFELRQAQERIERLEKHVSDMLNRGPALGTLPATPDTPGAMPAPAQAQTQSDGGDAAFQAAMDARNRGDFSGAETGFRDFAAAFPTHAKAPDARYWLGRSLMARGANAEAASEFVALLRASPRASVAPDTYVYLGSALRAMGQTEQACGAFGEFARRYPRAPAALKSAAQRESRLAECPIQP